METTRRNLGLRREHRLSSFAQQFGNEGAIYCCNLKPDCTLLQCDAELDASVDDAGGDATADASDE